MFLRSNGLCISSAGPRASRGTMQAIKAVPPQRRMSWAAAAAPGEATPQQASAVTAAGKATPRQQAHVLRTCRRCKQRFDPASNEQHSCRYHSALWTGGEISKAIGFCRESAAPEHQLRVVAGRTGIIRFWDCCGADQEDAPGCCTARHVTYDDPDD